MPVLRLPLLRSHLTLIYVLPVLSAASSTYLRNPFPQFPLADSCFLLLQLLEAYWVNESPCRAPYLSGSGGLALEVLARVIVPPFTVLACLEDLS